MPTVRTHQRPHFWLAMIPIALSCCVLLAVPRPGFSQTAQTAQTNPVIDLRSPDVLIKEVSTQILSTLQADATLRAGDPARVDQAVNTLLLPYTDFDRTTQIAAGRYWAQATPDQQRQLAQAFRILLVRTYAGALKNAGNQTLQFRPYRAAPDDTAVTVRTYVINKGEPVDVDYRLYRTPSGWKIYDVSILGLWLTNTYRDQFTPILDSQGVAGLLQALQVRNSGMSAAASDAP